MATVAIAGIAVGGFFLLKPQFLQAKQQADSTAPKSATPGATSSLPPVSTAPEVVQAIDASPTAAPPAGYVTHTIPVPPGKGSRGFSIGVPSGWQTSPMGQQTYQFSPDGGVSYLEIDLSRHVLGNMVADADYVANLERPDYPDYQPIAGRGKKYVQLENILGTAGALWQFDWLNKAVRMRVDVLLFNLGQQSYTITMTSPAGPSDVTWNTSVLPTMVGALHTFRSIG